MARTYGRLHAHLVWSTKDRAPFLEPEWRSRVYRYTSGIVTRCNGTLFIMNGVEDHVHLYLECPNTLSMATLVNKIKANTSRWIHDCLHRHDFAWQRGYGVFSVDSRKDHWLKEYIRNQEAHHAEVRFEEEYIGMLRQYGVVFDPRDVLD